MELSDQPLEVDYLRALIKADAFRSVEKFQRAHRGLLCGSQHLGQVDRGKVP